MKLGRRVAKKGFTLIELSFAIAFISILLITITLITNEIVSIYRKGYAIKSINQVGRDLIDDFQNSITQSPPTSTAAFCEANYKDDSTSMEHCESNHGFYSVYHQYYSSVKVVSGSAGASATEKQVPTGGIFCSGKYTYIWNTGYLFNTDGSYVFGDGTGNQTEIQNNLKLTVNYTTTSGTGSTNNFRLLKVEDASRSICASTIPAKTSSSSFNNGYPATNVALIAPGSTTQGSNRTITIPGTLANAPEELINESDSSLALFDLVVFQPARVTATNRLLFSGSFILATVTGGVDIMATGDYCQAPSYFSADYSYCAINKFNFTIQASGG